jgi:site-specific recombinase XerD
MQDATVASQMLGHTNLKTTAIYTRQIQSRMLDGVKDLGANLGAKSN